MGADDFGTIAPCLSHLTDSLVSEGRIGMCNGKIKIVDIATSCSTLESCSHGDRFKIVIPYAGQSITWEVIFDSHCPDQPPDFIFGEEDQDFTVDIDHVPSLIHWNPKKPDILLRAVEEILVQYRSYQRSLVTKSVRYQFEYTSLLELPDYQDDNTEIYIGRKSDKKIGQCNFQIKLPVNFSGIPAFLTKDCPGEDAAVLLIKFHSPDGTKVTPELYLSPRVEHAFCGSANLRIPSFPHGTCLMDYVPEICHLLRKKIDKVVHSFEKKKEYIASFLSHFGRSALEHDVEGFSKISFLFEWNDFYFIFHVEIPIHFPNLQPAFTFQSVYHENNGRPYTKVVADYPYSPRWSGNEMVERARNFILDFIPGFQKSSITGGSI